MEPMEPEAIAVSGRDISNEQSPDSDFFMSKWLKIHLKYMGNISFLIAILWVSFFCSFRWVAIMVDFFTHHLGITGRFRRS